MNQSNLQIAETRIGIIGTGFVARGLVRLLDNFPQLVTSKVLTRRHLNSITDHPQPHALTNSVDEVIENSDLIVECTGDVLHATEIISQVMDAGLPVVTMNSELQVTTGSYFVDKGFITEAEGDQPGSQAALKEEVELMGFTPLVLGNIKGFLNPNPSREDMLYWSQRNGMSLAATTNFTDGTKLQIEQVLVANGLGADIAQDGLVGPHDMSLEEAADKLGDIAADMGRPISDYVLNSAAPPGVFVVATHEDNLGKKLATYKMGDGPYYLLHRPYHLCFFEIPKTIFRVLEGRQPLLDNSPAPRTSVAAVAKRSLSADNVIKRGIGSFDVRGEAVTIVEQPDHVPIGLLDCAFLKHDIEPGQRITFADVDLPDSLALTIWREIHQRVGQAV